MKSFVVKLSEFFSLSRSGATGGDNFAHDKRHLRIPMYQREFKWDEPKIQCLVRDIANHAKFLGIIILDEGDNAYEIVDGQQRITTCFLIFMAMHNLYSGHQREQQHILDLMQLNNTFVLSNDSVGDYMNIDNGQINLCITDSNDIYFQKAKFESAYENVYNDLAKMKGNNTLRTFQNKMRDCEILVMVNETNTETLPIEQVFLDINEKSQLLECEDIFKGHCFANFTNDALHKELRQHWISLKKCSAQFGRFGYKDLSQYLYHYLLAHRDKSLPENLSPYGIHILDGKTIDETENLLKEMIDYGEKIIQFRESIGKDEYRFVDICPDSHARRNTNDHISLKLMAIEMLDIEHILYQKLPFFALIHALYKNDFGAALTHGILKKVFTNLYVYSTLFVLRGGRKSKGDINISIMDALKGRNPIPEIDRKAKQMRNDLLQTFEFKYNFKSTTLEFIYSIIDFYEAGQNWLTKKYTRDAGFTLEHFIIPNNRRRKVKWRAQTDFDFIISGNLNTYKRLAYNYIILPRELNEDLGHDDIVKKIAYINEWYAKRGGTVPKHIKIFIDHIKVLDSYRVLTGYKENDKTSRENIEQSYSEFIEDYFSEENQNQLSQKLKQSFQTAFRNNP
ncbi:MAG: DUF262 domain-containing protein [Oscillospiraceae bacterium]|nr:DUF262 domain-containing protein [Oscillospiraceae bacterium]